MMSSLAMLTAVSNEFDASHVYSPASLRESVENVKEEVEISMREEVSTATLSLLSTSLPLRSHVILGAGLPLALQSNTTSTADTRGAMLAGLSRNTTLPACERRARDTKQSINDGIGNFYST